MPPKPKTPTPSSSGGLYLIAAFGAALVIGTLIEQARGDGVAQVMTSKSLPEATVAVIDPESGTSTGTSGSDVRIAVGDIILFKFAFTPVPDKINRGLQGYLTEYLPPNTELVGVRITDSAGNTIEPRYPGLAVDGCLGGAACNSASNLPCASGTCNFQTGSIAQVHADTGVFYSNDSRVARSPSNLFVTMNNGITMSEQPATISPGIVALLGDTTGPYFAHNPWDYAQVRAYGATSGQGANGDGNTPYLYGSPVAGPGTFYRYEATDVSGNIRFNNVDGPWQRVRYPGSTVGTGVGNLGSSSNITRTLTETTGGFDLKPATPAAARAVRVALGETRTGEPGFVEVALRVTGVPLDPGFGTAGGNVDCGEVFGTDTSSRGGNSGAKDNPWPTYVGSPACVYLRLLFNLTVDKTLAVGSDTLNYTLTGKNLAVTTETNAVARLKYDGSRQGFLSATPAPTSNTTCTDDATLQCLTFNLGSLAPSQGYTIRAQFSVGGGGQTTNVMQASYQSTQLPAPGFTTQALTIVTGIAVPRVTLAPTATPTAAFATAGQPAAMSGSIINAGTEVWSQDSTTLVLPTGWTVNGSLTLDGTTYPCASSCATNRPTFNTAVSYNPGQIRLLSFNVNVPGGTATGLYRFDAQVWGSQSGFGGAFETYFPRAAFLNVGAVRTAPPTLTCPIGSTAPSIAGTAEGNAAVAVRFNAIDRGTATAAAGGAWTSSNYSGFGELYGGLEVTATATAPGKLISVPSAACFVESRRACSDGLDNDGDGFIDFPADVGCDSPGDNSETDPAAPQCNDGLDNDGDGPRDWPADPSCSGPTDTTESGAPACSDGVDNDGDGATDFPADGDCTSAADGTEVTYRQCQDGVDNDGDGRIDFAGRGAALADPGCHAEFDDSEADPNASPGDAKPRLLIAFDSSGSMNFNTCGDVFTGGDGTGECPGGDVACNSCGGVGCGNTIADDSRLFKVKAGITDAVASFGEVEYALMRFHQRATTFGCPTTQAGLRSGGWQGGGAAPCGGGFNAGDLLVSFARDNEGTLLDWIDGSSNYTSVTPPVGTDQEIRGSGTTPLAGILTTSRTYLQSVRTAQNDPRLNCRPYRVVLVTDGAETCGGDPVAAATALRNDGVLVYVIGFATPQQTVIANLNAIAAAGRPAVGGQPATAIFVDDEAELSAAIAQIIADSVVAERCNGADDDCDVLIDEDFPDKGNTCSNGQPGVCRRDGVRVCAGNGLGTVCNAPTVTPGTETCNGLDDDCDNAVDEGLGASCTCTPTTEVCNNQDDDCDGNVDEGALPGVGTECGFGVGECAPGALACQAGQLVCVGGQGPVTEVCNTLDDDCDSFTDEVALSCYTFPTGCGPGGCVGECRRGLQTCTAQGSLGACTGQVGPSTELCNGLDDDCDGLVDEAFPTLGNSCGNGQQGVCAQTGTLVCNTAGTGVTCTAPTVTPGVEVCNNLDDDCDGQVDDNLGAPIGGQCGGGGTCSVGTFQCVMGQVECVGSVGGQPEVCNGVDDDCDSFTDELPLPGVGGQCTDPGFESVGDTGECEFGSLVCENGTIGCENYVGPRPEVCNGLDDDCDGMTDDTVTCPSAGSACIQGTCARPCDNSEFPCPFGFYCSQSMGGRYCLPDPCLDVNCQAGFGCDQQTGQCEDLCEGVTCPGGLTCFGGVCQDCFSLGCQSGQICVRNQGGTGECIADPCAGVMCERNQACRDGTCVTVTCAPACGDGERCVDGQCVGDPCDGVNCPGDRICRPTDGMCVRDPCADVRCDLGEACNPGTGQCINDPCATIDCPADLLCYVGWDGEGSCETPRQPRRDTVTAAGGGCAAGGGEGGAGLALALALIGLATSRRRPVRARARR